MDAIDVRATIPTRVLAKEHGCGRVVGNPLGFDMATALVEIRRERKRSGPLAGDMWFDMREGRNRSWMCQRKIIHWS